MSDNFPVKDDTILSYVQAKRYGKWLMQQWRDLAQLIEDDILKIEDRDLRWAVAQLVSDVAAGHGHYVIVEAPGGFLIKEVALDDFACDRLLNRVTPDQLDEAVEWVINAMQDLSAVFVRWAFGRLRLGEREQRRSDLSKVHKLLFDRVVYDVKTDEIEGVATHPELSTKGVKVVSLGA
jgi:hypothetical protein